MKGPRDAASGAVRVASAPMPTSLVTGGAGFRARTSATTCSSLHTASSASTTSRPAPCDNSSTSRPRRVRLQAARHHRALRGRRAGRLRLPHGVAGEPDRLRALAAGNAAVGASGRSTARPGQGQAARFLLASTSEVYGDPLVHPQPESYWGNVNPIGPRGVYDEAKRYAEALTMAYRRSRASTPASCGSSTPTARGCAPTTAARFHLLDQALSDRP